MEKRFFEVFPTLKLKQEAAVLLEDTEVTKVAANKRRDFLRVHIRSTHILKARMLDEVAKEIKIQLFGGMQLQVEIVEQYQLSSQYTPKYLMMDYDDSFSYELEKQSSLLAHLFATSKREFEEEMLILSLEDSVAAHAKSEELKSFLQKVYEERFALPVRVQVTYHKAEESRLKGNEEKVLQEAEALLKQNPQEAYGSGNQADEMLGAAETSDGSASKKETAGDSGKAEKKQTGKTTDAKKESGKKEYKGYRTRYKGTSAPKDDQNQIYGRYFEDEPMELSAVTGEMGEITFRGKVMSFETREIKNERTIVMFTVTDFTDSIKVKMFIRNDMLPDILAEIKPGAFLKIRGVTSMDAYDRELVIASVYGIRRIPDYTSKRVDTAPKKRVELHCHTKMSEMDGVADTTAILKRAHSWGHAAIAITDHGVAQAFPDAHHFMQELDKSDPFKVIYGVEGYLVDDLQDIAIHEKGQSLDGDFVVFDLETTGLSAIKDRIIEIGAVRVKNGKVADTFSTFVNPERPISFEITKLTSITDQMVMDAPTIETVLPQFLDFVGDAVLVAHNAGFDVGFIEQNMRYQDLEPDFTSLDTVALARLLLPTLSKYKLNIVAKELGVSLEHHHRAVDDAMATAKIFEKFVEMMRDRGIEDLATLNRHGAKSKDTVKKLRAYHVIILAKNQVGRANLYRLISRSHLEHFARRPRIPKSLLSAHREGLLVGSACEAGELYQALLDGASDEKLARIVSFYDYLEVQPRGNNLFMIDSEKVSAVESEEDILNLNRRILELGDRFNKMVVATCDVHFLDPEDEVYRRIIMSGKGFADADKQAPLYLHTTEEMLDEFAYLGADRAKEIVIENPNRIADMIERISPVRPDKCPPVIPNSDQTLRDICYRKAHEMYGDPLPEIVVERLERELHSIITNGFAVMYIIAQKLVWKSNEDGYLVGSRGSVGSSFVATMAGITEVNPLSPHYYCRNCHYSDFTSEEVRSYAGGCGWDMPDKVCPECGTPLTKDGFDIPFETFLGFKGDKEPDIDLNFSGDYQALAHKYTEVIFGAGQTYRAGTIGTLADKTAFGYVKKYCEEHGTQKRKCEMERLAAGCSGARRSSGQHPGGIIVLPLGEEIDTFTPVQHPANDMTTDTVTTHFDYHSIDHNLLKLDILGHDDPTMIKTLEEYINSPSLKNEYNETDNRFVATNIPLDDPGVMSLFHDTSALGILPEDIGGCPVGCLGIPEFGTEFVVQMVVDTKPQTLSDLIRISGLSHGTDVWLNNAQDLILSGKATISTAICTRDDIMTYLIGKGLDPSESFNIMENVRKGKVAKGKVKQWPTFVEHMKEHGVPDWYIGSCETIKYMFPKAHAAAYVMMAYRIAYCKIYYPLAYYGAFFSIRASAFSYETMCMGKELLQAKMEEIRKMAAPTQKDQETLKDMKIVQEMYARGFEFLPIDIYSSEASKFKIVDGKLLPPFLSIDGMGEKAAEMAAQAAKDGKYLSRDDFRERTKMSKTVVEKMYELGLLEGLPESNQLSLFDL